MTKRFTPKALRQTVEQYNTYLADAALPFYFRAEGRNGYQAVDLHMVKENGRDSCERTVQTGTSRKCADAMISTYRELYNEKAHRLLYRDLTRAQAYGVLSRINDFSSDFHTQTEPDAEMVVTWARATKYRRPRNAEGHIGRYFLAHLARKFGE
jgi:hypothetical protein